MILASLGNLNKIDYPRLSQELRIENEMFSCWRLLVVVFLVVIFLKVMNLFKFKKNQQSEPEKPTIVDSDGDNMSVVTLIKDFIAGDVFLKETVQKQFLYVGLLFLLSLVYVNNRFLYEKELREVEKLRNEVVDLRYRSLTLSKDVKLAGRRAMIIEKLDAMGVELRESAKPIVIIED